VELHSLHGLVAMELRGGGSVPEALRGLLADLSFVRVDRELQVAPMLLDVRQATADVRQVQGGGRHVPYPDGLEVVESGGDMFVTDGSSLLHVEPSLGRATASIAGSFLAMPSLHQQRFWTIGILRLLRHRGLHALHAAGVVTPAGVRLLIVGPSGCGKSTLTIGLTERGGNFLSDDALLLCATPEGIEAMTLRKPFSVDAAAAGEYAACLPRSSPPSAASKRRVDMGRAYPERQLDRFRPEAIVLPQIADIDASRCRRVPRSEALYALLNQSGDVPCDRGSATARLEVLTRLLRQTTAWRLLAGRDLYRDPAALDELLTQGQEEPCLG
jgi:hypothetical protein